MAITSQDFVLTDTWHDTAGIPYQNIYYVRQTAGTVSSTNVIDCFLTYLSPRIQDILSTFMTNTLTSCYSLLDPLDYDSTVSSLAGTRPGQTSNSFSAVGYTIVRSSRAFRDSGKRYGRMAEADVNGNNFEAAFLTALGALQDGLLDTWVSGVNQAQLMMPKRVKVSGKYVLNDLSRPSAVKTAVVTSQLSRKRRA